MTDITGRSQDTPLPAVPRMRRREVAGAILRPVLAIGGTLGVYAIVPIRESTAAAVAVFALASLVVVGVVFLRRLGQIPHSRYPVVSAVESLVLVFGMFLSLFAFTYVSMSADSAESFTEPLDKVAGVYFSVTVLATVGFGDIAPISNEARILVTVQMILDLVLIGVAVKLLGNTARRVVAERTVTDTAPKPVITAMEERLHASPRDVERDATGSGTTVQAVGEGTRPDREGESDE